MDFLIAKDVAIKFPHLSIHYAEIHRLSKAFPGSIPGPYIGDLRLTAKEIDLYRDFREDIAGLRLLAVERLQQLGGDKLPSPHPVTSEIIKASFRTHIPITVFSPDELVSPLILRFSQPGEFLLVEGKNIALSKQSLVAATQQCIIGQFGIRSASIGTLTPESSKLLVLSFGLDKMTSLKSSVLVSRITEAIALQIGSYFSESMVRDAEIQHSTPS